MCGRYGLAKKKEDLKKRFRLKKLPEEVSFHYNIAPSQNVPAILNESPDELSLVRWGLLPGWADPEKFKLNLINCKCETLLEKPMFKGLVKSKRCLILADGFYEWKQTDSGKQPYRILLKTEETFAFAGIWDRWERDGKAVVSCSIITTEPNEHCKEIHNRMPVILPVEREMDWLGDLKPEGLADLMKPYPAQEMKSHRISTAINNPSNKTIEVIQVVI